MNYLAINCGSRPSQRFVIVPAKGKGKVLGNIVQQEIEGGRVVETLITWADAQRVADMLASDKEWFRPGNRETREYWEISSK